MLVSPHYLILLCQQQFLHSVCAYEKAILLKIFIKLAMRVDAPIVGNVLLFRISLIFGTHMSFLRKFLVHSRRGLTHPLKSSPNLKKVVISGMVREAKSRLAIKIDREGWKGHIDQVWVELVAGAPKRQCGGIARYTLLRWAVNQDDDVWLSMRGTRHQQNACTVAF